MDLHLYSPETSLQNFVECCLKSVACTILSKLDLLTSLSLRCGAFLKQSLSMMQGNAMEGCSSWCLYGAGAPNKVSIVLLTAISDGPLADLGASYQVLAMSLRVVLFRTVRLMAPLVSPLQSHKGVLKNLPVNCSSRPRAKRLDLKIDVQEDNSPKGKSWCKASVGLALRMVGQLGMISRPSDLFR